MRAVCDLEFLVSFKESLCFQKALPIVSRSELVNRISRYSFYYSPPRPDTTRALSSVDQELALAQRR